MFVDGFELKVVEERRVWNLVLITDFFGANIFSALEFQLLHFWGHFFVVAVCALRIYYERRNWVIFSQHGSLWNQIIFEILSHGFNSQLFFNVDFKKTVFLDAALSWDRQIIPCFCSICGLVACLVLTHRFCPLDIINRYKRLTSLISGAKYPLRSSNL